jgi:hypothetical protein
LCGAAVFVCLGLPAAESSSEIIAKHTIPFSEPARRVPAQNMVDGPLLGNGDVGVVIAGTPEQLRFHIGKNDFWGVRTQAPMAVGQVQVCTAGMDGASYAAECDMQKAEWRGRFSKGGGSLAARAWVDANANRLFIELTNAGKEPLRSTVKLIQGAAAASVPAQVNEGKSPALAGCEQHGGKRWFFNGQMADVKVEDKALSDAEIAALAKTEPGEAQSFDGKTSRALTVPAITKSLSISGWIKANDYSATEADYFVSKGEWNQAYSLGLSQGHVRFAVNGMFVQTADVLAKNRWVHLAAVFNGRSMAVYMDGQAKKKLGGDAGETAGMAFLYDPDAGKPDGRKMAVVVRALGSENESLTIPAGETAVVVAVILSDLDAKDPLAEAKAQAAALTRETVNASSAKHQQWWQAFWNRSFVEIPDKVIEQHWYSSQYIMASCSRSGKVAPGLWGNWITRDDTHWHGDFHLNYNFQAPYYSVYSANHPDVSLPFYDALNQFLPRGKRIAEKRGWKGVHLPVSIGPWGMCPEGDGADWGQRSDAAYAALNFVWYYQYTQDTDWLKTSGYPYLREVAAFWEDYLKFANGRYVIYNDSIHEGSGGDVNAILSLGLVRTLFKNVLVMSSDLGVDADKRAKWQDICDKISDWPLQERGGKTVFRYSEKGTAWWNDNTLGIQHIYPAGAIGLDSPPKVLEISRNMIDAMSRWADNNGSSSWYTACARIGYDPKAILTHMRQMYDKHSMPNKILYFGGGGIENVSPSLAVNEMLLQSHEGVLRFFPCWPKDQDARFGTLRGCGAFLVSAELKGGAISGVKIVSERGKPCAVQNPWPGHSVRVLRNGQPAENATGALFTLKTAANEVLELSPAAPK